jgi:hypothetical protein
MFYHENQRAESNQPIELSIDLSGGMIYSYESKGEITMKTKRISLSTAVLFLALVMAVFLSACKEKTAAPPPAQEITMDNLAAILDLAGPQNSGIAELRKTDQGFLIGYHLYLAGPQDFDEMFGKDLSPKIEKLYKTFETMDNVTVDVSTPKLAGTGGWQPYCSFDMTRKIYNQLNWTNLMAADLFKVCKVNFGK